MIDATTAVASSPAAHTDARTDATCFVRPASDRFRVGVRAASRTALETLFPFARRLDTGAVGRVGDDVVIARIEDTELLAYEERTNASFDWPATARWPVWTEDRYNGWCAFEIAGWSAARMFEYACAIDLSRHVFRNLTVVQTLFFRVNATIVRADSPCGPAYTVFSCRSYQHHLAAHLKKYAALVRKDEPRPDKSALRPGLVATAPAG